MGHDSFFSKDTHVVMQTPLMVETKFDPSIIAAAVEAAVRGAFQTWAEEFRSAITREPLFYTDKMLADELGIAELTVKRLRRAGKIKFKRVGGKPVYTRRHIEEFLSK
jgi:predicted transcriptional regulator